ncbi:Rabphilin-3A [Merluccius polli]|uniref:Rabphilin-3A n=1 Tax=Merluccius polli TaxID=89951 RepID=A0AA47PBJ0_MERPO|nr:Rabphilin-3A [Merluccius polli]
MEWEWSGNVLLVKALMHHDGRRAAQADKVNMNTSAGAPGAELTDEEKEIINSVIARASIMENMEQQRIRYLFVFFTLTRFTSGQTDVVCHEADRGICICKAPVSNS